MRNKFPIVSFGLETMSNNALQLIGQAIVADIEWIKSTHPQKSPNIRIGQLYEVITELQRRNFDVSYLKEQLNKHSK
jgi:hypothetical protein